MTPAAGFNWAGASAHSSLSESTLRRWARKGVLKIAKVGGRVIVLRDSLEALMRGEVITSPPVTTTRPAKPRGTMASTGREPNHSVLTRGRRR